MLNEVRPDPQDPRLDRGMFGKIETMVEIRSVQQVALDTRGVIALEFAIVLPLILTVLVIATDLSLALYASEQVKNAARAGAEFAATTGYYVDGIKNAAVNSVSPRKVVTVAAANVTPTEFCGCSVGGSITNVTQSGSNVPPLCLGPACSTGFSPVLYASVRVDKVNYNAIFPNLWGGLATTRALSATFVARTF